MATSINKTKFISTVEGVYVYYIDEAPEAGPLVLAIALEQKDEARLGKPRLYPDTINGGNKIKVANGEYYAFLTNEVAQELEFIDGKYLIVNPIIVPSAKSLANKAKTKLEAF